MHSVQLHVLNIVVCFDGKPLAVVNVCCIRFRVDLDHLIHRQELQLQRCHHGTIGRVCREQHVRQRKRAIYNLVQACDVWSWVYTLLPRLQCLRPHHHFTGQIHLVVLVKKAKHLDHHWQ